MCVCVYIYTQIYTRIHLIIEQYKDFIVIINCHTVYTINLTKKMSSCRYLTEEGIAELKGSNEKITLHEIIRIVLDVSSYV